ncbi:universal stress protein [Jidongwangia harbinensis]|uniref:universal stress protein n=1 Tax=Jidongwangia harbinensis TaxID=2878561 RepID=UPI001CD9974D|nr:universal stress protein [Jidongwangia harbinensis]MCA2218351.1 universal stress protein [Jidongwangia harbinensis]
MHIVLAANPEVDQPWVADAVIDLARQTGATVATVAVDEMELERFAPVPRSVYAERAEQAASAAAQRLTDAGIVTTSTVLPGKPLQRIMEFAEAEKADLIVVGSSAKPAVAQRLLGSVPLELIRKSKRPVLVVTHPHRAG